MYHTFLQDRELFERLLGIDRQMAAELQAGGWARERAGHSVPELARKLRKAVDLVSLTCR